MVGKGVLIGNMTSLLKLSIVETSLALLLLIDAEKKMTRNVVFWSVWPREAQPVDLEEDVDVSSLALFGPHENEAAFASHQPKPRYKIEYRVPDE